MPNSDVLLQELEQYRNAILDHRKDLENQYTVLSHRYRTFSDVYEGEAAEEFKRGWEKTGLRFTEYIVSTGKIIQLLDARIDSLRGFNRSESL
jgi:hypothetical protein